MAALDTGGESWTWSDGRLRCDEDDDDFAAAAGIFKGALALPEDESVARYLRRFDGDEAMRETAEAARVFVEGFDAADPAIASARAIADEWSSGVDSTLARPLGGYPPVVERLRSDCAAAGVRTYLSTIVRRVAWQRGSVRVEVTNGSRERQTWQARAAVVTLPVGVLRQNGEEGGVVFEPVLPERKRAPLAHIEMGHVVKVVLSFRTDFWTKLHGGAYRNASFFRSHGQPFAAYWTQLPVRSEFVAAWAGGPAAIALDGVAQAEVVERALTGFASLFGEPARAHNEFESGAMHDWRSDPFARGAYSYVAAGGGDARVALGRPVDDTLFFAGEATSGDGQGGTVNGALQSGERAAREAATSLGAATEAPTVARRA